MSRTLKANPDHFEIDTAGGGRWVLHGPLDADAAPAMTEAFAHALERGEASVALDLSGVSMISSAGVGSLIAGVGELRDEGIPVRVCAVSPAVHHVLAMLDLIEYFGCPEVSG